MSFFSSVAQSCPTLCDPMNCSTPANINNLRYADDTTLMAESKEKLKSLLMKLKEESEKIGLKSTFRKLRSWHLVPSLHGKYGGNSDTLYFGGAPKSLQMVTAAMKLKNAYSLKEKP